MSRSAVTRGDAKADAVAAIDRFWRSLRFHMGSRSATVNRRLRMARIRAAQWSYWNQGEDLWAKMGELFQDIA